MSRTSCSSASSTSATRRCGFGGTGSARCSPVRSAASGFSECEPLHAGDGASTRASVKINGEMRYLWRAVDHEGEVLVLCHHHARQGCCAEIHQEGDEAPRPAGLSARGAWRARPLAPSAGAWSNPHEIAGFGR
ncbi:DDE-type integrase/transposase/recombinase [Phenylobacterium glaciei]|uniref:DDE-type integrase/transposase/recombinase n=1 Tax=Phenylobacterium glaciei TaxID=2803784 RepID=UPI003D313161